MDVVVNYADDRVEARLVTGPLTIVPVSTLEKTSPTCPHNYPLYDAYDKKRENPKTVTLERIGKYEVNVHIVSHDIFVHATLVTTGLTTSTKPKLVLQSEKVGNLPFWHNFTMQWLVLDPPCVINRLLLENHNPKNVDCEVLVEIRYCS